MIILSKNNPAVKALAALKEKKGRRERGTFLVEGGKMVSECAACGMEILRVALCETQAHSFGWAQSVAGEVLLFGKDAFGAISDEKTPQGVLAEVRMPQNAVIPPEKSCLMLDGVSDPANVGAVIRTAAAAGYGEIYLTDDCADPFAPKSVRASMSGVFYAKLMRGAREEIFAALQGVPLFAADMDGENVFSFVPPEKFCLCIGNEGNGLSEEVRTRASRFLSIPMEGRVESLNAAVSAGIAMYALKH